MNNNNAAQPAFEQVKETPQQMRAKIAEAINHPHLLSFTLLGSQEAVCGRMTTLRPGQGENDTQVRVTLTNGSRIIIYIPCTGEARPVATYTFAVGIPEN